MGVLNSKQRPIRADGNRHRALWESGIGGKVEILRFAQDDNKIWMTVDLDAVRARNLLQARMDLLTTYCPVKLESFQTRPAGQAFSATSGTRSLSQTYVNLGLSETGPDTNWCAF